MKSRETIAPIGVQPQMIQDGQSIHITRAHLFKLIALAIPAAVMISALFFPLQAWARQALIGVILIWIYAGAMIGFSFLE